MAPESPSTAVETRQVDLMERARAAASFDSFELSCIIYGGAEVVRLRKAAYERVENQLGTADTSILPRCYGNVNREQAYEAGLEEGTVAFLDGLKYEHDFFLEVTPRGILVNASPIGLSLLFFGPTIELCGSPEQKAKWLPLVKDGRVIGTYCQTELGHGTFLRGIETTATLDTATSEFIIHSPTKSSAKFWPGGLGYSSTHAIVMARLIIRAKDYGTHLFIVQLRSVKDGKCLPGIKLGDIGLKFAYNGVDNGFATFTNVRVPLSDMLARFAAVAPDGTYTAVPDHIVLNYSMMLRGRNIIARVSTFQLAQATTIAIRYSTVREQGVGIRGDKLPVFYYKHQHFRLLTLVAKSYGMLFASKHCNVEYNKVIQQREQGDLSGLAHMHALTAGLKAWNTGEAANGSEDARKSCGGHGFLVISGLPDLVGSCAGTATFEGENYVLWLQVGRYLFKCVDALQQGRQVHPEMAYLAEKMNDSRTEGDANPTFFEARTYDFLGRNIQLEIYRHRARQLIYAVHKTVRGSKKAPEEAWNDHMLAIITASRAHVEYNILRAFDDHLTGLRGTISAPLEHVLDKLCSLFALSIIVNPISTDAVSFIEGGQLSIPQLQTVRWLVNDLLLEELIFEAVALTDAWDFTDANLCSALGMKNGDVYATMMRWVEQLPINQRAWKEHEGVYKPGWKKYIDPILKAKL